VPRWGGPVEEIRPSDLVWIPPGEKHRHGATAITAMTHIAIQEKLDGKAVRSSNGWKRSSTTNIASNLSA
jgi:quercetin dioxygenase-like cupin family protein